MEMPIPQLEGMHGDSREIHVTKKAAVATFIMPQPLFSYKFYLIISLTLLSMASLS